MATDQNKPHDPLDFVRSMWGNSSGFALPGMVTPTFDVEELEKRITDLKAVEGWLRMNLSMLQMTIQGLEMQKTTLSAVRTMGQMASAATHSGQSDAGAADAGSALSQAAMWPWNMMQQLQQQAAAAAAAATPQAEPPAKK
ncbi:MAG: hypothetical protein RIR00_27 [Pseudomonadota bacterium]|jgi:hypothetical protein